MKATFQFLTLVFLTGITVASMAQSTPKSSLKMTTEPTSTAPGLATATFGTGCFWCTEAVFESLEGVYNVVSGYAGGHVPNPTYKAVCDGTTGHAECVQLQYDPAKISYSDLLEAFFRSHDPTTLNRQGNDIGTQYRSVIYYHSPEQQQLATQIRQELDKAGAFGKPIVTEISPAGTFYAAEAYHQNYFANNPEQGYCAYVVAPKLDKFRKVFKDKLRKELIH
jgi:peptide-methionine (S)-S-oxide reductase